MKFYSKCDGKSLEGSEQKNNTVCFLFLRGLSAVVLRTACRDRDNSRSREASWEAPDLVQGKDA